MNKYLNQLSVSKLNCSICGRSSNNLGLSSNTELYPEWLVCNRCFEIADKLAAQEDRWPDRRDFKKLKGMEKKEYERLVRECRRDNRV